ncbi:MAG: hypothetical protein GX594_11780 [Pirellulaceae bacterium]|nr:hypothetical protein [Pirellulaceae bacterium]
MLIGLLVMATPLRAQIGDAPNSPEGLFAQQPQEAVVTLRAEFTPSTAQQSGQLSIVAHIKPTWHIYSITQPPGGPLPTEIKLRPSEAFHVLGDFLATPSPERESEPAFNDLTIETHQDRVTWRAPIEIHSGVDPATLKIEGVVRVQPCNPDACLPPQEVDFIALAVEKAVAPAEMPILVDPRKKQLAEAGNENRQARDAQPVKKTDTFPAAIKTLPSESIRDTGNQLQAGGGSEPKRAAMDLMVSEERHQTSFVAIICFGFLGGLILNLMPCVLPVIGLKILSFVQQAGQSRRQVLTLNLWYSLGMLLVFLLLASLAVFLSLGWGQLFSFTGFNVALAAVVFTMGLSLLGVWEIPIPGLFGAGKANELSQKEGALGAFCKGALTTILATPCSGPFLASALAWTVGQPPEKTYAVFLSVGVGMASPYLLIGVFPGLMRFLPKPGAWMDTFKQVMGFVLLGTVAYLLTLIPWAYVVPTVAFLFGLWAACWWIGRMPLTSAFSQKARAWISATAFAGMVWFVTFGWLAGVMADRFDRTLRTASGGMEIASTGQDDNQLSWRPFSRRAFDELTAAQKTVLVDFTADWCMTCKTLEKFVLNTPQTCSAVRQNGVATLQADWTHASPEVTEMLERLGSKQVPVIAIFPAENPDRPIILRGSYTQETLLGALKKAGPSKIQRFSEALSDGGKCVGKTWR